MHKRDHVTRYRPMFSVGSWSFERENQSLPSLCFSVSISRKNQKKSTVMIVGLCPSHITILFLCFEVTTTGLLRLLYKEHSFGLRGLFSFFFLWGGNSKYFKKMFSRARLKCLFIFFGGEC